MSLRNPPRCTSSSSSSSSGRSRSSSTGALSTTARAAASAAASDHPSRDFRWEYDIGCATLPGTDPDRPQKVNQDGFFFFQGTTATATATATTLDENDEDDDTRIVVIGVMDGHGLQGQQVVQFLQRQLPVRLQQYLGLVRGGTADNASIADPGPQEFMELMEQQRNDLVELGHADRSELQRSTTNGGLPQALVHAFLAAQLDARMDSTIPTGRSGTTCVVGVVVERLGVDSGSRLQLHTACVGDSRAIHWTKNSSDDDNNSHWNKRTVQSLTRATTVQLPNERDRIEQCQGRIDSCGNVFYGPVGIAMTRSLGNAVLLRAGVLPIPMLTEIELSHGGPVNSKLDTMHDSLDSNYVSHYICAGTDGVFDVLSNEQVMDIIDACVSDESSSSSLDMAAEEVCRQARMAWLADLPIETNVDDVTCVILRCSRGSDAI